MNRNLIFPLAALCLAACSSRATGDSTEIRRFKLDAFERIELPDAAAAVYRNDSLFLGDPHVIRVHPDGYMVLLDVRNTEQIVIVDPATDAIQTAVKHGRGPTEIMSVRDVAIRGNDIWLSGISDQKILRLTPDNERRFAAEQVCRTADQFLRAVPFTEGRILALASASSDDRFHLLGTDGVTRDTVGSFPASGQIADLKPNNAIFQSDIGVSPDGSYTVAACRSLEYIDIYDADMNLQHRLQGPQGIDPAVKVINTEIGTRFMQDPMWFVFNDIAVGDKAFMIGYTGISPTTDADFDAGINTLLVFDRHARPQRAYRLESDIVSFDMDWKNDRLYCLRNSPEPQIVMYDLKKAK